MAPSAKKLETALIDATCQVFKAEPDATSVNKVRRQAEENLELEDGFFAGGQWKQKSKSLIKEYVVSDNHVSECIARDSPDWYT